MSPALHACVGSTAVFTLCLIPGACQLSPPVNSAHSKPEGPQPHHGRHGRHGRHPPIVYNPALEALVTMTAQYSRLHHYSTYLLRPRNSISWLPISMSLLPAGELGTMRTLELPVGAPPATPPADSCLGGGSGGPVLLIEAAAAEPTSGRPGGEAVRKGVGESGRAVRLQ
jgi:hypothetical protein